MVRYRTDDKLFLLHPTRRNIYKILCENPGTYFYKLMKQGSESSATLLYHLSKLEDDGLITSAKIDGKRIYFPKNLRTKEIERAYMLLKNKNALHIFLYIVNNEPCFQNQIAREFNLHHDTIRHHAARLADAELIEKEKKGKHVFFRIGRVGKAILEGSIILFSESYIRFIISKLADDCHFPEIVSRTKDQLTIRVVCPGEDDIMLSIDISNWDVPLMEESKKMD
ncbi:MAG: winged helix-turn-helix transcriptional regulator [Promethearchaeota archaeon]